MRLALGLSYLGSAYDGWQSQASGHTVQDHLEKALAQFTSRKIITLCAGRTDAGVHGMRQVVHFNTTVDRDLNSWVRGTNAYLPQDIAVQWAQHVSDEFHARRSALTRRYTYLVLESSVRPSLEIGRVGWVYRPMQLAPLKAAAQHLLGEHDFTSFRAASCQALSPVKHMLQINIQRIGRHENSGYWRFDFEANAFLHHMIRNLMGCFVAIGQGSRTPDWMLEVLQARNRRAAAPTFSPNGLYFMGPTYDSQWGIPEFAPSYDWLPGQSP